MKKIALSLVVVLLLVGCSSTEKVKDDSKEVFGEEYYYQIALDTFSSDKSGDFHGKTQYGNSQNGMGIVGFYGTIQSDIMDYRISELHPEYKEYGHSTVYSLTEGYIRTTGPSNFNVMVPYAVDKIRNYEISNCQIDSTGEVLTCIEEEINAGSGMDYYSLIYIAKFYFDEEDHLINASVKHNRINTSEYIEEYSDIRIVRDFFSSEYDDLKEKYIISENVLERFVYFNYFIDEFYFEY